MRIHQLLHLQVQLIVERGFYLVLYFKGETMQPLLSEVMFCSQAGLRLTLLQLYLNLLLYLMDFLHQVYFIIIIVHPGISVEGHLQVQGFRHFLSLYNMSPPPLVLVLHDYAYFLNYGQIVFLHYHMFQLIFHLILSMIKVHWDSLRR